MIYDSDTYVVVHLIANDPILPSDQLIFPPRHVFEIVNKTTNMEVLLVDEWAALFHTQVDAWKEVAPAQKEVEAVLEGYCELAQIPLMVH